MATRTIVSIVTARRTRPQGGGRAIAGLGGTREETHGTGGVALA